MDVVVHDSLEAFWQQAGPLYEADPGRHSVALTTLTALASECGAHTGSDPVLVTVHDADLVGAYLRTPPSPAHVGALPQELAPAAVEALRAADPTVDVVFGPEPEAHAFVDAWCAGGSARKEVVMRQRRYELGELAPPAGVDGNERSFDDADVPWLARWRAEYARDAGDCGVDPEPSEGALRTFIAGGREPVLWAVDDEPAAMAFVSRPVLGMSRISNVYTPVGFRGRGYGSAVTAAASREAHDMGAGLVMLYTDLANPVSNSIYQRIGFAPVDDLVQLRLRRE